MGVCVQSVEINNEAQCCVSVPGLPCRGWGHHYADWLECGAGPSCEGWAAQRVPANLLLVPGSCLTSAPATLTSPHLALLRAPLRGHLLCVCIR